MKRKRRKTNNNQWRVAKKRRITKWKSDKEVKFVDFQESIPMPNAWTNLSPATSGTISGITQGFDESERIGRVYTLLSVHVRYFISIPQQEAVNNPLQDIFGRIVIGLDTQTNEDLTDVNDVFDTSGADQLTTFRNLQFTKRFKIYADIPFLIARHGNTSSGGANNFNAPANTTGLLTFNRRFPGGIRVNTNGVTGDVGSLTDNSLFILGVSNDATAVINYTSRVRYSG